MTKAFVLITQGGFLLPAWKLAWPNVQITENASPSNLPNASLAVVAAGVDDWQQVVKYYSEKNTQVLVLSSEGTLAEFQQALLAGARGFIDALSSAESLQNASEAILSGALWVPPSFLNSLIGTINKILPPAEINPFEQLTDREQQVAEAVCRGLSNKAIANELDISERTVKLHLTSTFSKLGVKDRMQLLLLSRKA